MHRGAQPLIISMPQWQGGDIAGYFDGARLLREHVAVSTGRPVPEIPVSPPPVGSFGIVNAPVHEGISSRQAIIEQYRAAARTLEAAGPESVLLLGGDCATSLAPISYFADLDSDLGVVWIDAHPDMWDASQQSHANAMALAVLTGLDTAGLATELPALVDPNRVVWVGTRAELSFDTIEIDTVWRNRLVARDVNQSPAKVVAALQRKRVRRIAIHLDLDVLDPSELEEVAVGEEGGLTWESVSKLVAALVEEFDVVSCTIAEVVPSQSELSSAARSGIDRLLRALGVQVEAP